MKRIEMKRLLIIGIMLCSAAPEMSTLSSAADREKAGSCTKTAHDSLRACHHEVEGNFWIAMGNCDNLSDPDARPDCRQKAEVARKDGKQECGAQFGARLVVCESIGQAPYDPEIDPAMFVDPAEIGTSIAPNPYFPLVRGRTWVYTGGTETIRVAVTEHTKKILGVTCAVVHDVVEDNGEVIEDTEDWYAQDINGNVWYLGEISHEFENGELLSIEGSWKAGVDGAKAGLIMKAAPVVGDVYRQEFALGEAEDMGKILSLTGSAVVPAATCNGDCLVTKDFTPLEPDAFERKYYAPGIGLILEVNPETGASLKLVTLEQ